MLGSGVKNSIFGNIDGTHAITHERYMGTLLTKVTQRVCDSLQLGATTSSSKIHSLCGRMGYTRLFVRRPQNKWITQKLARPRCWLPIDSTPRKVGIQKTIREREEDAEYQIPSSGVSRRYLEINLTACQCEVFGNAENERTDTKKTGCPALSASSTRGSQSCSGTASGPQALRPRLRPRPVL
jgi:hypothetical protein